MLLATGIDPERSVVFLQNHVPAAAEAALLLATSTTFGELRRMTQFKEKAETQALVSAALFTYPVLMAADVLLYQTDTVPIGDDQRQHLELTRRVAERFNARFGATFSVPEGVFPDVGARIMDLQDPTRKMSTTCGSELGTLLILDPPDVVAKKIRSAVTDAGTEVRYEPSAKPGVSNLIEILHVATGEGIESIEGRHAGNGYGDFKREVAAAVIELLEPVRERFREVRPDEANLRRVLAVGAERARAASLPTLEQMYERMGFVRPTAP
jgi:tryptophanyl-tRNA synthetase